MDEPIFISFASNDRKAAEAICNALERRGMRCWIATRNIGPGENFQEAITRAIRSAKVMILVFSGHANNSLEVKKEIALAGRYNVIVVPVRVEDVVPNDALSYELAVRQWIDMFEDWEQAIERLVTQVATVVGTEPVSVGAVAPITAEPSVEPDSTPARAAAAPAPPAAQPRQRSPMAYVAATLALVIVAGGALLWQLWPAHRSTAARAPHTQTATTAVSPPAAPADTASPAASTPQRPAAAQPAPQPNPPPQTAATAPSSPPAPLASPPEAPRGEAVERALSALRERRAEREQIDPENRTGEMNRAPAFEGLVRDRFQRAEAMRAAREEHSGRPFRDCPHCPEMVVVPAGRFEMGSDAAERDRFAVSSRSAEHEQPQHTVTIARPFALAKFEVTRGEFRAFVTATSFVTPRGCVVLIDGQPIHKPDLSWENPGFEQTDRDPVVCVNLREIDAYIEWLRVQTGKLYRLPTEAEWEYATRAGTRTAFYWGDSPDQVCEYENVGDATAMKKFIAMPCRDGFARTAPVGSFKPNPFGLHDMLGNVHEFTADCWVPNYNSAPGDGSAQLNPGCMMRATRKASFGNGTPMYFRAAHRFGEPAGVRRNSIGFRVALTLP